MSEVTVSSPIERVWEPTKKQKEFISLPFSFFEALYGGAVASGKSEILLLLPLIYNFHQHPLFKGLILRRTFPELESEIILRSKEWYSHAGGIYNESKKRWTFSSGAVISFGHAEREDDIRKYDTAQFNYVGWDECTSFTPYQYRYLTFSRIRSRCSDLPAICRAGTNPGNIGHSYFRERFVDPHKAGFRPLVDKNTGLKRIFIPATVYDNPIFIKNNPTYIHQLEQLPEADRRAKLYGDWYTYLGQVFKEFRIEPLSDEPINAKHVVDDFEIPLWWPRIIAIDWGFTAMCWIGWLAISPSGQVFVYREYAEKEKKHEDWITDLINLTGDEKASVESIWICHSANQNRGEPNTIREKVSTAINNNGFNCTVNLGSKGRVNGKMNVHEYLRWKKKDDIIKISNEVFDLDRANQLFRLYGEKAYKQYIDIFTSEKDEGILPKLQIMSSCAQLVKTIPNCVYDDTNPEDVKEFDGDDPYDGIRIGLDGVKEYILKNAKKLAEMKDRENAINEIGKGDQTSFYRRMEHLEKSNSFNNSIRKKSFLRVSRMQRMQGSKGISRGR